MMVIIIRKIQGLCDLKFLTELYSIYCLCGGMPEAVKKWVATGDLYECLTVQTDLLATYRDDFNKYGKDRALLRKTLRSAAEQLGLTRMKPQEVKSGSEGAMKSLHQFMFEKQLKAAVRLDINNFSRSNLSVKTTQGNPVQYTLFSIPIYLAERVFELLD
jgi:hypothetical protein